MLLLLVRHAHAGDRDPVAYPDDRLRPLTDKGRKTQKQVARWLRDQGLEPATILASPWTRAWQTGEILATQTGDGETAIPLVECPALAASPVLARIHKAIGAPGTADRVALVGHEPWLSQLASLLLAGGGDALTIDFPKSGTMGIETPRAAAGEGVLRFFMRPKLL